MPAPIAILGTGLVTSVGLTAPASCAAMRAKISNARATHFMDSAGEPVMAHQVPLDQPSGGRARLVRMAALAIDECLSGAATASASDIPFLLCVAERERPGRLDGIDTTLLGAIEDELALRFAPASAVIPQGRVGVAVALARARQLLYQGDASQVLVAATDSLLRWPTLRAYLHADRVLAGRNSNGFMPGEGAGALLIGKPSGRAELVCTGLGFATEAAPVESGQPLRGEGLAQAIRSALAEADCQLHDFHLRIADVAGEQYYFKEAALGIARIVRKTMPEFDLWHPAESTGETGAVAGTLVVAMADAACRKSYVPGPNIMAQFASDTGARAAAALRFGAA